MCRWWEQQNDQKKESVRNLVSQGRLEIVNAGWSMNDEACPYYTQIIDNMMIGHKFLKEELGVTSKIGWHLDPFGHTSGNAAMFADMGFDAFFYSRLDYQDKEKRLLEKSMEYVWRPFPQDKPYGSEIFTHAMYEHYYPPPGFCWATSTCGYYDEPVVKDPYLKTNNYLERIAEMYEWVSHMKDHFRTKHLLIPMGGDFFYKNAHKIFINTDRLIEYFNEQYTDFKLIYSTPGNYIKAVHESNATFPVKYDDQVPYAEKAFSYWTGFYSSRPVSKGNIRSLSRYTNMMNNQWTHTLLNKQTPQNLKEKILFESQEALRIVGVMQHHDAVTGTERQHVSDDYQKQVETALNSTRTLNSDIIRNRFENIDKLGQVQETTICKKRQDGVLVCPHHVFENLTDTTYINFEKTNSEAVIRLYLPHSKFKLVDPRTSQDVPNQFIDCEGENNTTCVLQLKDSVSGSEILQLVRDNNSTYLLKPGISRIWNNYQSLMFNRMNSDSVIVWAVNCDTPRDDPFFGDKTLCTEHNITIGLRAYTAYEGDDQPSGAYVFRPANGTNSSDPYWRPIGFRSYNHPTEHYGILKFYGDTANITLTLLPNDTNGIQVLTEFSGIHETDHGKEITLNIGVFNFDNKGEFYTDSNGLQLQKRKLNYRPDWELKINGTELISANYYPITSAISMQNVGFRGDWLSLLNDRTQGGSALQSNGLEVMIDRRFFKDDNKGLEEALNETDSNGQPLQVNLQSIILLEKSVQNYTAHYGFSRIKECQKRMDAHVEATVVRTTKKIQLAQDSFKKQAAPLHGLIIQTYPVALDEIIVRVENPEDWVTSPNIEYVDCNITEIAHTIYQNSNNGATASQVSIQEVTLSASQTLEEREQHRLIWRTEASFTPKAARKENMLYRQEMRTYRVRYGEKASSHSKSHQETM